MKNDYYASFAQRDSALKTGRREVPGSISVALVDLAVRSYSWFSPKLG